MNPPIPRVEFIVNLVMSEIPSVGLPCKMLLIAMLRSSILLEKFVIDISIKSGVTLL